MHSSITAISGPGSPRFGNFSVYNWIERLLSSSFRLRSLILWLEKQEQTVDTTNSQTVLFSDIIFIMDLAESRGPLPRRQKPANNFPLHAKHKSQTAKLLEMFHIPSQVTIDPPRQSLNQQKEQSSRAVTPFEKIHRLREKMFSQSSRRNEPTDSSSIKACTFQFRGKVCGEYNNNLFERQIVIENSQEKDYDLTREGRLIAKYLKFISKKASKSLEHGEGKKNQTISSLHWLKDNQKKHSFVDQLEKYQSERQKKASEVKQIWFECLPQKYTVTETRPEGSPSASIKKYSPKGLFNRFAQRAANDKLANFKIIKQRRRTRDPQEHIQLKPWDNTKDDYYSFL